MMSHTVTLHRVFRAPAERLYRAFLTAEALAKWLPPHGFICTVHQLDVREGGRFKMSFTNFSNSQSHSFGGEYLELSPNQQIRYTDVFNDPNLPGQMITSVSFTPVLCGTEVKVVQQGIPAEIPPEMCYLGWQESLQLLALLVEAEVPAA